MAGIFTRAFWRDTAERAASTAAESAILALGAGQLDAIHADWRTVGGFAAGGAILTVLKAVVASRVGDPTTASFTEHDDTPPKG